jgi:hypothetical protein
MKMRDLQQSLEKILGTSRALDDKYNSILHGNEWLKDPYDGPDMDPDADPCHGKGWGLPAAKPWGPKYPTLPEDNPDEVDDLKRRRLQLETDNEHLKKTVEELQARIAKLQEERKSERQEFKKREAEMKAMMEQLRALIKNLEEAQQEAEHQLELERESQRKRDLYV